MDNNFKMIQFAEDGLSLDVRVDAERETVWLTQAEMAELFGVDRTRITRHMQASSQITKWKSKVMCGKRTLLMLLDRFPYIA